MADILASVSVVLGAEVSQFKAAMADARRELKGLREAGEALKEAGNGLTKYMSAPLALIGAASLKVGGDFQAAFNRVQAATQATGAGLAELRAKAQGIALDPKLQFSSVQAAQAMEALAKNGLSTTQILGGAADASTALATATGAQLATAADITTDVMNNFGKSAQQAAGLVSNITGTTIASKFAIDDYRQALGQAGAVAGQLGVSFEDFNTALGVTSSGFSSGSDAGTSFKTFLQRLVPQSKEAEQAIKQLGLNFFDAQGKMQPLRAIAGQLQQAFKGLSDQQRNALGTKIFGADSIRTALLLAKEGSAGFDQMAASIGKVNAASQGAILNQGFTGGLESFKSSLEGLGQAIADSGLLRFADTILRKAAGLAAGLAQLSPEVLNAGVVLAGLAAATGPALLAIGTLGAALPALTAGFTTLGITSVAALGPIGVAAGVVAAAGLLIYENWDRVAPLFESISATISGVASSLSSAFAPIASLFTDLAGEVELLRPLGRILTDQLVLPLRLLAGALDVVIGGARILAVVLTGDLSGAVRGAKQIVDGLGLALFNVRNASAGAQQGFEGAAGGGGEFGTSLLRASGILVDFTTQVQGFTGGLPKFGAAITVQTGLLARLHEQLKQLKEDQQAAGTEKAALAFNPLIDNLQKYIARLEGSSKTSKAAADAITKLRQELARLMALDNLLGDTPSQLQVLERRAATLVTGLKGLVDAGVSPASRAFQGFAADMVKTSQAADKLLAGLGKNGQPDLLDFKPASIKGLIPTTIGDTLPQDVTRLLGDYAKQPIELSLKALVKVQEIGFTTEPFKVLNQELITLGNNFREISGAQQLGIEFDAAGAKASALQGTIRNLLAAGLSPASEELKKLAQEFKNLAFSSQVAAELKASIMDLTGGIATAFSDSVSGLQSFGASLASTLLSTIGDLAVRLGNIILASGLGIQALEVSLKSFTGLPAIAAGIGLLAIGGIAKGAVSNLGKTGGAVSSGAISAPRPTNYGQNSNQTTIKVLAEFKLRGQDFVAFGQQKNYRNKVTD